MMKHYLKYIQYSISIIFLIVSLVSLFNYKIDSLGLFGNSTYLSDAARSITNRKMIAGLKNYDHRLFQELIIKNLQVKNDVIAIGSSKAMQLRKRHFLEDKVNFFNHSVGGASLEDYISIVGIYEKIQGYIPSKIILGIDPWVFNTNSGERRWETISKYYGYELEKIYGRKKVIKQGINFAKWKQLVNYDYTISNINFFVALITSKNGSVFYVTDTIDVDDSIMEADGSIHRNYKLRYPDYVQVERSAVRSAKGNVYSLNKFKALDNTELFSDFITYLQNKNIEITFFLHPYHPSAYNLIVENKKYKYLELSEKYLIQYSKDNNITVKGSYDPSKFNIINENFYDDMHGDESVAQKIFNSGMH